MTAPRTCRCIGPRIVNDVRYHTPFCSYCGNWVLGAPTNPKLPPIPSCKCIYIGGKRMATCAECNGNAATDRAYNRQAVKPLSDYSNKEGIKG